MPIRANSPAAANFAANFLAALIFAESAQNLKIKPHNQGRVQGFEGISRLTVLLTMSYGTLTSHNGNAGNELAGNSAADRGVRLPA